MISSAVKIVPGMQLRLFTWKGGEDIDIAVIPEEPGPPHALLQFAFKGVQLNLLQQRVLICGYQEAAPIILHPPEARPPILPLVHVSPKVAGNQLVILVHAVPKWMPAEFSLPTSPLSSNILKVIISRFCFLAISLT